VPPPGALSGGAPERFPLQGDPEESISTVRPTGSFRRPDLGDDGEEILSLFFPCFGLQLDADIGEKEGGGGGCGRFVSTSKSG